MGYSLSLVGSALFSGISMAEGNLDENGKMIWWLRFHPIPNFSRIMFILTNNCAWYECVSQFDNADSEVFTCLKCLYFNAIFYLILGIYLEKVMPSQYGIPKHPLFFIEP